MPCRCDTDFSTYKRYPSSRIDEYTVQKGITKALGLYGESNHRVSPINTFDYFDALGINIGLEKDRNLLSRVFILNSMGSTSPTELYFIPRPDDQYQPRYFDNPRKVITDLLLFSRAFRVNHGSIDVSSLSFSSNQTERNLLLSGKCSKMTIDLKVAIDGVGGLPGLSTPMTDPRYENDISQDERAAHFQKLLIDTLINGFTIPCPKFKKNQQKVTNQIKSPSLLLGNRNVLASIFEFIDTLSLVNTVASVCPLFHELIIYDNESGDQIYSGKMLKFCNLNLVQVNHQDILKFKRFHKSSSWLEFYLMSGMVFLEYFKEDICKLTGLKNSNQIFGYSGYQMCYLILDPTMLITNESVLKSISEKRKKIIAIGSGSGILSNVSNKKENPSSEQSLIRSIISSPVINCYRKEFSVNLEDGISLYSEFLKSLASKLRNLDILSSDDPRSLLSLQYVIEKIVQKAKYFIEQSLTQPFDIVSDDVLFGLHFVLLDNYYNSFTIENIPFLDFTLLLENRKKPRPNLRTCNFPEDLSTDFFSLLISKNIVVPFQHQFGSVNIFQTNPFEQVSAQQKILNTQSFIKEHFIELSTIPVSECSVKLYTNFLTDWDTERPTKPVDMMYHFHMLHAIEYYQDIMGFAGCIKYHRLFEPVAVPISPFGSFQ